MYLMYSENWNQLVVLFDVAKDCFIFSFSRLNYMNPNVEVVEIACNVAETVFDRATLIGAMQCYLANSIQRHRLHCLFFEKADQPDNLR